MPGTWTVRREVCPELPAQLPAPCRQFLSSLRNCDTKHTRLLLGDSLIRVYLICPHPPGLFYSSLALFGSGVLAAQGELSSPDPARGDHRTWKNRMFSLPGMSGPAVCVFPWLWPKLTRGCWGIHQHGLCSQRRAGTGCSRVALCSVRRGWVCAALSLRGLVRELRNKTQPRYLCMGLLLGGTFHHSAGFWKGFLACLGLLQQTPREWHDASSRCYGNPPSRLMRKENAR